MAENILCDFCGQPATIIDAETFTLFCDRCFSVTKTCGACIKSTQCDFETNPSPLPKQVQKTVRQGNMTMQTVVKNPARIQLCCTGCDCFDIESQGCFKENGVCSNYNEITSVTPSRT